MVPLRQCAEIFFIFPPIFFDIGNIVPLLEFRSNIIRATNFVEESVPTNDLEGLLVRIEFRNCLHHIELSLRNTGLFIVCEKILQSFYKLSFLASGRRLEPDCPERYARKII